MKYREFDALAAEQRIAGDDDRRAVNHVNKKTLKAAKASVGEVVFDPEGHKDFVTGFRKRKQQRRSKALKELQVKQKVERLAFRAEKRKKTKENLGLAEDWHVTDSEEEDKKDVGVGHVRSTEIREFAGQHVMTTVTTMALDSGPESAESEEDGSSLDGNGRQAGGAGPSHTHGNADHGAASRMNGIHQSKRQAKFMTKPQRKGGKGGNVSDNRTSRMIQKLSSKGSKPRAHGKSRKGGKTRGN